eukprot:5687703-Pleurochrysis_carterae.AAC.6
MHLQATRFASTVRGSGDRSNGVGGRTCTAAAVRTILTFAAAPRFGRQWQRRRLRQREKLSSSGDGGRRRRNKENGAVQTCWEKNLRAYAPADGWTLALSLITCAAACLRILHACKVCACLYGACAYFQLMSQLARPVRALYVH